LNAVPAAKPFGTGAITLTPGGTIRLAAATNINANQLTATSDLGGIAAIGLSYNGNPTALPALSVTSTAPWKATLALSGVGFSQNVNQATLWAAALTWVPHSVTLLSSPALWRRIAPRSAWALARAPSALVVL